MKAASCNYDYISKTSAIFRYHESPEQFSYSHLTTVLRENDVKGGTGGKNNFNEIALTWKAARAESDADDEVRRRT